MSEQARGALVLSAVEFDVVWRGLGLGTPPVVLQLSSPGRTRTQRRCIEEQVWAALRDRGIAADADFGLGPLLGLLAAPSPRVEVRAWGVSTVRAVVAGYRDGGVLARRRADAVVLEPCVSVAGAAAGVVAGGRPGPGRAAVVPDAALTAALCSPSGAGLRTDLVTHGADPIEAGLAARMLNGVSGRAQIHVTVPDRWDVVRRSPDLLEIVDGPHGRYLLTRSDGVDGTRWATVAPVDDRRLRSRVVDLLDREMVELSPGLRAASAAGPPL